ncbi:MAG: hypothetical protein WD894_22970 [Pirellulales bacterium]
MSQRDFKPPGGNSADRRRWRFGFSLSTFLLCVTVTVLVFSHWTTSLNLRNAQQALSSLRREHGYLHNIDPSGVTVISVPSIESKTWRWRVFIPAGSIYRFTVATERIPTNGFPDYEDGAITVRPGESLLIGHVWKNEFNHWQWSLCVENDAGTTTQTSTIPDEHAKWLSYDWVRNEELIQKSRIIGRSGQETFSVGDSILLLHEWVDKWRWDEKDGPQFTPGLMFWLAPGAAREDEVPGGDDAT